VERNIDLSGITIYSAVCSDICDQLGFRAQSLDVSVSPINGGQTLVGWARTVSSRAVSDEPSRPYEGEIAFVDSLATGDVVVAQITGSSSAFWGELFSSAALARGARGAVIDGFVRDAERLQSIPFPILAAGTRPTDCQGRIAIDATGAPLLIGGVVISEGDLIVADRDGIVAVPSAIAAEVIRLADQKARTESSAHDVLRNGGLLRDVWQEFGVL